jgi:hypothetical protein
MLYFSCSFGPSTESTKACWDMSHQTSVSRVRNVDALFFMLVWAWCGSHKKHIGTHYAELVLLHLVRSMVMYCVLVRPGHETSLHYISCSTGPCADPRDIRESHHKQEDQDVQSAMESPYCGWRDLGGRRRVEGRIFEFPSRSDWILGSRFILRGVGL